MNGFFQKYHRYLLLVLFVVLLQGKSFYESRDQISARCPAFDYDSYWHLLRVQEIHRTGSWDNEIYPRGNAPFGERIHWTHAMDLVLWAGASVGSLFGDFDSSLYWWGVFVGPVLYTLSLIVLLLLGRTLGKPKYVMYLGLMFIGNLPQLFVVYSVNRPDHHCLVAFAYVLYYCLFVVLLERPESPAIAVLTGLVGALGLWCGTELLIVVGLSLLYLGSLWLLRGREYLKANFLLALALATGLAITVLLDEKPSHYLTVAYDKRSIVHAALFFFVCLFWLTAALITRTHLGKTVGSRFTMALGGAGCILLPYLVLFPDFLGGPMAKVDPRLYALYLGRTSEFGTMSATSSVAEVVYNVLLAIPGLVYLIWGAYKGRGTNRIIFSWLAVLIGVYAILAVSMSRWVYTLAFVSILPSTFLLIGLWNSQRARRHPFVAVATTILLLCAPYGALIPLRSSIKVRAEESKDYDSKLIAMLSYLEPQEYTAGGEIILANICIGPAIMYHTSLDAVGTPNHNNDRGIIDTHRILNCEDDAGAYKLIQARGIDYLLIDEPLKEFAAFRIDSLTESNGSPPEATFLGRLTHGHVPAWLTHMPLPDELADTFALYRVSVDGGSR
jgi:hypothetical protein